MNEPYPANTSDTSDLDSWLAAHPDDKLSMSVPAGMQDTSVGKTLDSDLGTPNLPARPPDRELKLDRQPTGLDMTLGQEPTDDLDAYLSSHRDEDISARRRLATDILDAANNSRSPIDLPDAYTKELMEEALSGTDWKTSLQSAAKGLGVSTGPLGEPRLNWTLGGAGEVAKEAGKSLLGMAATAGKSFYEQTLWPIVHPIRTMRGEKPGGGAVTGLAEGAMSLGDLVASGFASAISPFIDQDSRVDAWHAVWKQQHDTAQKTHDLRKATGGENFPASEEAFSFGAQIAGLEPAAPAFRGAGKVISKTASGIAENVPYDLAGAAMRTGVFGLRSYRLIPGVKKVGNVASALADFLKKNAGETGTLGEAVKKSTLQNIDELGQASIATEGQLATDLQNNVSREISSNLKREQVFRQSDTAKINPAKVDGMTEGQYTFPESDLTKEELKVRNLLNERKDLQAKFDRLETWKKVERFFQSGTKLGLTGLGTTAFGGTTLAGIASIGALPEDIEQRAGEGFTTGVALTIPALLPVSAEVLRTSKSDYLRRQGDVLSPIGEEYAKTQGGHGEAFGGIPDLAKRSVNVYNGILSKTGTGWVYKVVSPEELKTKASINKNQEAPMGYLDKANKTAWLRSDALRNGVQAHEFGHIVDEVSNNVLADTYGKILSDMKAPDSTTLTSLNTFLNEYMAGVRQSDPYAKTISEDSLMKEGAAELTRFLLSQTPIEELYSGKTLGKSITSALSALRKDPQVYQFGAFKVPFTRSQVAQLSDALFGLGRKIRRGDIPVAPEEAVDPVIESDTTIPKEVQRQADIVSKQIGRPLVSEDHLKQAMGELGAGADPSQVVSRAYDISQGRDKPSEQAPQQVSEELPSESAARDKEWDKQANARVQEYVDQGIPEDQAVQMVANELPPPVQGRPIEAQFMPSTHPEAIASAAVQDADGKIYRGTYHGTAIDRAHAAKARGFSVNDESWDVPYRVGFVTNDGKFLSREQAFVIGKQFGQIPENLEGRWGDPDGVVHSSDFRRQDQFMPSVSDIGFYSKLEQVAEDKVPNGKSEASRVLATLRSGGVKDNELKWVMGDFLDRNPNPAKQELLNHIRENKVLVEEKALGQPSHDVEAWWNDEGGANEPKPWNQLSQAEHTKAIRRYKDEVEDYAENAPQYEAHTLPGYTPGSYRELLLTWPDPGNPEWAGLLGARSRGGGSVLSPQEEARFQELDKAKRGQFTSSHFGGEPNIVAHLRLAEYTDSAGSKIPVLNELQSDWSQKIRKEGIQQSTEEVDRLQAIRNERLKALEADPSAQNLALFEEASNAAQNAYPKHPGYPDMPFKSTDSWTSLALKRAIKYAVDNGYSKLGWTTGEQQVARYDLSEHLSQVNSAKTIQGQYAIQAVDHNGEIVIDDVFDGGKLPEVVGKDLAEKIINETPEGNVPGRPYPASFSGLDLRVGGEGMKGYYDQIVPKLAKQIGKQFGAKVGQAEVTTAQPVEPPRMHIDSFRDKFVVRNGVSQLLSDVKKDRATWADTPEKAWKLDTREQAEGILREAQDAYRNIPLESETVHTLEITPEMAEAVKAKGQPMFMPMPNDPGAVSATNPAGIRTPDGKIWVGSWHPQAYANMTEHYSVEQLGKWASEHGDMNYFEKGVMLNNGKMVSEKEGHDISLAKGQMTEMDFERMKAQQKRAGLPERDFESLAFKAAQKAKPTMSEQWMPEVNIGLHVGGEEKLTPNDVIDALKGAGVGVTRFHVDRGKGREPTVVASLSRPLTRKEGDAIAEALGQSAIPQHEGGGKGTMFGRGDPDHPEWNVFNPDYFIQHNSRPLSENLTAGHAGEPLPGRTGARGIWDSLATKGQNHELAKEIGIPHDKHYYEQKPEAKSKIDQHFIGRGEAQYMPSFVPKSARKFITPEEEAILDSGIKNAAGRFMSIWSGRPDVKKGVEYAQLGRAQKLWYDDAAQKIVDIFGSDADRFAALTASFSPNTAVEPNLEMALAMWDRWVQAGRPTDKAVIGDMVHDGIADAMARLPSRDATHSGATVYTPNVIRSLTAEDASPARLRLSGPKVGSFHPNLTTSVEMLREVTNDRHIAKYMTGNPNVDSSVYGENRKVVGGDRKSVKTPEYIATSAHLRQVAARLTEIDGQAWTPRQAQAAIWSYILLKEGRGSGAKGVETSDTPGFTARLEKYQNPF